MQLPFLKNKDSGRSYFFSLLIKPYKVAVILFAEVDGKLFILSTHEEELKENSSEISDEALLAAVDRAVSFVEGSLPEGSSVEKTIFSLPYDWIIEAKIKPEYLERLKTLCKALELVPIGYLTSIEAIVHSIEKAEGAPVSAVFVEIAKDRVLSYMVRSGKILEVCVELVEGSIVEAAEHSLQKIESVDVLPAKIILINTNANQETQQDFLSHKWPETIPFLHVPQVVTLASGFENEATINGVANQMELQVLAGVKAPEVEVKKKDVLEEISGKELGFLKEGEEMVEAVDDEIINDAEDIKGKGDVDEEPNVKYFKEESAEDTQVVEKVKESKKFVLPPLFAGILGQLRNVKIFSLPVVSKLLPGGAHRPKLIIGAALLLGVIIMVAFVYYNFILRAEITVFTEAKVIDKSTPVTFSQDGEADSIRLIIAEEEIEGEETKNSTGKKETGDKAAGTITIYNKTDGRKTFTKGTVLVGPNNLAFELMEDVNVASTSSFATSLSSSPGKVQAEKFGKVHNLPSNSNFTVKGFPTADFIGKNSDAIGGGTSKTTTVVSKKDLDDLLAQVIKKLEGEAITSASSKVARDESIFTKALSREVITQKYTKKEGDEAANVELSATIKYSIGKYKKSDVQEFVEELSKDEIPQTYVAKNGGADVLVEEVEIDKDGERASATLRVNAVYSPKIEMTALTDGIRGKTPNFAERRIKSITGVTDVIVSLKNKLPLFPSLLPSKSKNIIIEIKS